MVGDTKIVVLIIKARGNLLLFPTTLGRMGQCESKSLPDLLGRLPSVVSWPSPVPFPVRLYFPSRTSYLLSHLAPRKENERGGKRSYQTKRSNDKVTVGDKTG